MNSQSVTSPDGTRIAWTRQGAGPPLVMVHCVAVSRATTPQPTLPNALARHFTVYTYDRRGTGESGNTGPYSVEREFEDLGAVMALDPRDPVVYGFSSGATLALQAAEAGAPIRSLALLEPPLFADEDPTFTLRVEAQRRIDSDLADAHHWFDTEVVGVPEDVLAGMPPLSDEGLRNTRTIVHELTFLPGTPAHRFATVETPTLLMASDHTAQEIRQWAMELEKEMPNAKLRVLAGEWHGVDDATLMQTIWHHVSNGS
ncbi:alpha/beta hydrolase [Arthrobacter sp. H35-D1]|uniref:alpha/beta fold hydrolase n=1 Tax=Arthrobacter sp. H35-D1 TaxID=3046202 RepID=UPI0024B91907|nr:alpha/beta hydrolase [Arthrobacter sp. H35-D1]MDJ0314777.1 alpha/beta hydrolase [Arthrobacter sp. H35-D1]